MTNYQKIDKKFKKCWGQIESFLPWSQNLNLTLRPSFFIYFWFWCQTEIVSKKVYAVICLVLEITSLKFFYVVSSKTQHCAFAGLCSGIERLIHSTTFQPWNLSNEISSDCVNTQTDMRLVLKSAKMCNLNCTLGAW